MYKKISKNEKVTRKISEVHSADNYLTKEITENVSLAVTKLNGNLDSSKIENERVYYFIVANVDFVLYLEKGTTYSACGDFEAVTINVPAYGVKKELR